MSALFGIKKEKFFELWHLFARNVFLLINAIIFAVVFLLIHFGNVKEGIFLGAIITVNIFLGIAQDIHAWLTLERLHLLTILRITRRDKNGTESKVLPEELQKGDEVILHLGDQVPCDGLVLSEKSLEANEALITGESGSFRREEGDRILAGSIITSGTGILKVETIYRESRIAKMTAKIKRYTENSSPIQKSVETMVKYSGYALVLVIIFVVLRGKTAGEPELSIIKSIGALASTIVPQGLVIATTLIFAYGTARMFRRHVLLQDVNAAEKLGRIKNLCLDKTGTLTETALTVEEMHVCSGLSEEEARYFVSTYMSESGDDSQTVRAITKYLGPSRGSEIREAVSFSSERRYGWVLLKGTHGREVVLAGAPDAFIPHLSDKSEKEWLTLLMDTHARAGKRLMCVARARGMEFTRNLEGSSLSLVAVFILENHLRSGIRETIDFFQKRGVTIRIISGDNPDTVRSIADVAGVNHTEKIITGMEMDAWDEATYAEKSEQYAIFARIKPEQKEKIIKALKRDGFTAMVGDGANDALAIKKADLGIAMFDGAPATRQIASIVLTNNSFAELPGGVKMADSIIKNIEIFASIFFNQTFAGFFLFLWISALGYSYPLTPLNVTLINYFTIGLPGLLISYWAIKPNENAAKESEQSFLKRVLPFPFVAAIIQSLCIMAIFAVNFGRVSEDGMRTLVVVSFAAVGFVFFLLAPRVYKGYTLLSQKIQFVALGLIEIFVMFIVFYFSALREFFNIVAFPIASFAGMFLFLFVSIAAHIVFVQSFFPKMKEAP